MSPHAEPPSATEQDVAGLVERLNELCVITADETVCEAAAVLSTLAAERNEAVAKMVKAADEAAYYLNLYDRAGGDPQAHKTDLEISEARATALEAERDEAKRLSRLNYDDATQLAGRLEVSEAQLARTREALQDARKVMRNAWGAITSDQVVDKQVDKMLKRGFETIDEALRSPAPADGRGEDDGLGDGKRICEALGFDPTNHHNALKCPYCNPDSLSFATPIEPPTEARDEVKVKALEWNDSYPDRICGSNAQTPFGSYMVGDCRGYCHGNMDKAFSLTIPDQHFETLYGVDRWFDTPAKAKAAAQADYEHRIRSALSVPSTPAQTDARGWQDISTAPRDRTWFEARTEDGYIRRVHYDDRFDRLPIDGTGEAWSAVPIEWRQLPSSTAQTGDV